MFPWCVSGGDAVMSVMRFYETFSFQMTYIHLLF